MIEGDGKYDDRARHDLLYPVLQTALRAADLDDRHDAGAGNRPDDSALAAGQAAAADDDSSNDAKLRADRNRGVADRQSRELHDARKPGERAGNRVDGNLGPFDAHAAQASCSLIRSNRKQVSPKARELEC